MLQALVLRRSCWIAFAAVTLALAAAIPGQPVDAQNHALKAPAGPDADRARALQELVDDGPVVVVAFAAPADLALTDGERSGLAAARTAIAALPDVVAVTDAPVPDPGLALAAVRIAGTDLLATGERVVATARAHAPPGVQVLATGLPLLEGTIARLVAAERTTIVPLLMGVLLAAAWLCYRRLGIAVAVLLPPLCGIAWTGGALAWLGHPLDPIASLLEPVLLTIGVATSVHFVEGFRSHLRTGASRGAAAARAASELRTPALLATATTMIGLWSLTTSDIPAVIDFGVRSALGVGLTHLFAFLLLPAWLALVPAPVPRRAARLPRWLLGVARWRTAVLAGTCGLTALAAAGLGRLRADNDPLRLLPANDPVRAAHERLALRLGGVETFHLLVPATERAVAPERLLPWLAAVRQLPGIAGLAGGVVRGAEGDLAVPLLLQPAGSAVRAPLFTSCERLARVLGFADSAPAGPAVRIARDSDRLLHGLLGSLGLSAALLGGGMAIGLGSAWLGALGLLINLLPSIWLYGALAWLGQPISVATAMIGCTMLGLIVDNSLHLLHHYRTCRRRHDARGAMRRALARCARPMTLASAVLALGFLTAATSRLATTVEFALLASATIALAWFGTTIVLPLWLVPRLAGRAEVARAA